MALQQAPAWTNCCDQLSSSIPTFQSLYKLGAGRNFGGKSFSSVEWRVDEQINFCSSCCSDGANGIFSYRLRGLWICFAQGDKREKKQEQQQQPKTWKKPVKRGTAMKAVNLIKAITNVSDCKEDIYGALDAWSAFEVKFPIESVKRALRILRDQWQWRRVIQVSKWMLSKGHGKTMATYQLLMIALDKEDRIDEAEEVFQGVFRRYMDAVPRGHFALMLGIYKRAGMHEKLLDLFADMEELGVRPDQSIVETVAQVYTKIGMPEKSEKVRLKYPVTRWEYRYLKGRRIRVPTKRLYPELRSKKPSQEDDDEDQHEEDQDDEDDDDDEFVDEDAETMGDDSELLDKLLLGEPIGEELIETRWQERSFSS